MAVLEIPDRWSHFISQWDGYRKLYESFCIFEGHWYKGLGPDRESSLDALTANVHAFRHVGKLEPSRYIKDPGAFRQATIPPKVLDGLNLGDLDL